MKKQILIATLCATTLGFASSTLAADEMNGTYIGLKALATYQQMDNLQDVLGSYGDKQDTTFGAGIAVGYDFGATTNVPVRTELEYAYRSKAEKQIVNTVNAEIGVQTLGVNVYYDFKLSGGFTPYIGGGIGVALADGEISSGSVSFSDDTTSFAWNVGAGIGYSINKNWTMDLGYRYADFGEGKIQAALSSKTDLSAHEVLLGLRYTF